MTINAKMIVLLLTGLLAFDTGLALAERVEVKGVGTYVYPGGQAPIADDLATTSAIANAKESAWKNYVASLNSAQQQVINRYEKELIVNLDRFIVDTVVIDSAKDHLTNTLKVAVRIAFNDDSIRQFVEKQSVGNGQQNMRSEDSLFSFLFMSRKAATITQYDDRKTVVAQVEAAVTNAADGAVNATQKISLGGSTLKKQDAVTYSVSSSEDLDSSMGEVITNSGIEYVGYDDIVASCKAPTVKSFQDEFVGSDTLSPQSRSAIINAARNCEVRYFAYGTIDTEISNIDPVTGNQMVFVSVRSQLWDISKKLPRKIGSVGPKQYSGLGPNQNIAGRNALKIAASDLAKTLVDQLNAKGIR